jgi:hypothetical protein
MNISHLFVSKQKTALKELANLGILGKDMYLDIHNLCNGDYQAIITEIKKRLENKTIVVSCEPTRSEVNRIL